MREPTKAVFLSYAREDAEAVRRIADALRAFGVEVWFDQNELRGGDAWDQKIRTQIRTCTLCLPVISASTQARGEGYFRREWKFAVERTYDMAAGVPFLLPIVIDDTAESAATVPDEFMRVQWTRLAHGVPTPQFVEQVKRLLEGKVAPGSDRRMGTVANTDAGQRPALPKRALPGWTWGAVAAVVVVVAGVMLSRQAPPPPAPVAASASEPKPAPKSNDTSPKALAKGDKSIAVLPFTNMSEDKESGFFADGVHEDVLTNLALIRELRVVSRTSVMQFRETKKSIGQVAQELGVTYVLEGSVRRSGNKVRVTGQLIHAGTDEHIWAASYDRELTDIFTIQAELSRQIAGALKAALSPEEKVMLARRPTENPAAYDLYLRARDIRNREGITDAGVQQGILLLESAVKLDPRFAQAWGELAETYAFGCFTFQPGMEQLLAKAKAAIDQAVQLAPDDPGVISSLGTYYYYGYRDYARATEQYERLASRQPNDPTVFNSLALIQRRQGHWAESLANSRRATELDPANLGFLRVKLATLSAGNRYAELEEAQRRIVTLQPDRLIEGLNLAVIPFLARGSTREGDEFIARLTPGPANSSQGLNVRQTWARLRGDLAEAIRLDQLQPYYDDDGTPHAEQAFYAAADLWARGDQAAAIARLGEFPVQLRARLAAEPDNPRTLNFLAGMEIILGHKAEGLRYSDRAAELVPVARDSLDGTTAEIIHAFNYDAAGEKERALAEYTRLMRAPSPYGWMNIYARKAAFSTLRGDRRYEALLNDPKNNAPLF